MSDILRFNVHISDVEKINPLFSKCKIYVCYYGKNRNNSYISKDLIVSKIGTIFNIPIIGEYLQDADNFGGHGGKIEITDEGAKYIQTALPYGVVPESASVYWENVTEDNGEVREYLVIDGAYLWTGRYPEVEMLLDDKFGQSMEIEIHKGVFKLIEGETVYEVRDFSFSALCILGINKESDPYGHVEPCFESASIVAYSLDKDRFRSEFNEMISDLKFALSEQGGNEMENTKETELQIEEQEQVEEVTETEETEATVEEQTDPEATATEDKEEHEEFALTVVQLRNEVSAAVDSIETITEQYEDWSYEYGRYELIDIDTENGYVVAYDYVDWKIVGFDYSVDGDKVNLDTQSLRRFKINYVPMELGEEVSEFTFGKCHVDKNKEAYSVINNKLSETKNEFNKLQNEHNELKEKYEQMFNEYSSMKTQERLNQENELFDSFSKELTEEEMAPVKEAKDNYTIDELTTQLYTLVGKKKAKFTTTQKKKYIDLDDQEPTKKQKKGKSYDYMFE